MDISVARGFAFQCHVCFWLGFFLVGVGEGQTFFADVTAESIGDSVFSARNTAFGDYDNDGRLDILLLESVTDGAGWLGYTEMPLLLLHNEGNNRFSNLTDIIQVDVEPSEIFSGCASFGDYDNDGDLDLAMSTVLRSGGSMLLLRNDRGRFTDVSLRADLSGVNTPDMLVWLDYDRDGYLDLYVADFVWDAPETRDKLYRNNRDGSFSDVTEESGLKRQLSPEGGGSDGGIAAGDFNNDGWPDLYLGVYLGPNRLLLNNGHGIFEDATNQEIGDEGTAWGCAVGDIDNDGDLDIFQLAGGTHLEYRSLMLLNLGKGQFLDVTEGVGLQSIGAGSGLGTGMSDIDNDGDIDLLTGYIDPVGGQHEGNFRLFLNRGDGTVEDMSSKSGVSRGAWKNIALGDFDLDGFADAIVGGLFLQHRLGGLYHNNGNENHWLEVEVVGTASNRCGIGTRLDASAGNLRQMREVLGGRGISQDELAVHFGIGQHTQVDELEIRWPSGQTDILTNIPADEKIRVIEGRGEYYSVRPTVWEVSPPDTMAIGSAFTATIRPALFEPTAKITQITADFSQLGDSSAIPLQDRDDGTYALDQVVLPVGLSNGVTTLSVMIDQETSLGSSWTRLSRQMVILPADDLGIFDDALLDGWRITPALKVGLDLEAWAPGYQGNKAIGVQTAGIWRVTCRPSERVDPVGYRALRFAFHPGDAVGSDLKVGVDSGRHNMVDLLSSNGVDLSVPDWQVVELSLDTFEVGNAIDFILFSGRIEGTFYLDDIRLIAATPPPSTTAVTEAHAATLPPAFTLDQNYPNPFNNSTVIRFSLPIAGSISLSIYNLAGQKVASLVSGARVRGEYSIHWDGTDDSGSTLATGIYLCRLRSSTYQETKKLLLVR